MTIIAMTTPAPIKDPWRRKAVAPEPQGSTLQSSKLQEFMTSNDCDHLLTTRLCAQVFPDSVPSGALLIQQRFTGP